MTKTPFLLLVLGLISVSCITRPPHPTLNLKSESDYSNHVEKNTQKKQIYDGLYAIVETQATLLTSNLLDHQVDFLAQQFQWTQEQYKLETEKSLELRKKQSDVFLSFYVPERKHDDLAKAKTVWRIFLDSNGQRYEGKAAKISAIYGEIKALYPHHNRWSTAYKITFPVSIKSIENSVSKLTMTGPIGSVQLEFKPQ
jgi:hypothetical protein